MNESDSCTERVVTPIAVKMVDNLIIGVIMAYQSTLIALEQAQGTNRHIFLAQSRCDVDSNGVHLTTSRHVRELS